MKRFSKDMLRNVGEYLPEEDLARLSETSRFMRDTFIDRKWLEKLARDRQSDVEYKEGEPDLKQLRATKNMWFFQYLQDKLEMEDETVFGIFEEIDSNIIKAFVREANIVDIDKALRYVTGENFSDASKDIFIQLLEYGLGAVGKKDLVKRYIMSYLEDGKYLDKYLQSENMWTGALYGPIKSFHFLIRSALRNRRDDLYDILKSDDFREDFSTELNSLLSDRSISDDFYNYLIEVSRD